jgi:hypothetical protein
MCKYVETGPGLLLEVWIIDHKIDFHHPMRDQVKLICEEACNTVFENEVCG